LQANTKYPLESSRRDRHNALLCTALKSKNVWVKISQLFATFFKQFAYVLLNFAQVLPKIQMLPEFYDGFRKRQDMS
jgi:hypothetical protein